MKLEILRELLDRATDGAIYAMTEVCDRAGWRPRAFIQTSLDGLPDGQMRLICYGVDEDTEQVRYFETAAIEGEAQLAGWNMRVAQLLDGVRKGLKRAERGIQKLDGGLDPEDRPAARDDDGMAF